MFSLSTFYNLSHQFTQTIYLILFPKKKNLLSNPTNYNNFISSLNNSSFLSWQLDPISKYYDHLLIKSRLDQMKIYISCQSTNVFEIKELLRQGFLRNFAGILHPSLHPNSCTKKLILDYLSTTVDLLNYIAQISMMEGWKLENRISFFNHAQSSFGKTALMLEGGATFGLYHLGVIKCLLNQKLLPKIIAGF